MKEVLKVPLQSKHVIRSYFRMRHAVTSCRELRKCGRHHVSHSCRNRLWDGDSSSPFSLAPQMMMVKRLSRGKSYRADLDFSHLRRWERWGTGLKSSFVWYWRCISEEPARNTGRRKPKTTRAQKKKRGGGRR